MRFYQQQHRFYCGVDLHARTMYLCVLDQAGTILFHHNLSADPDAFRQAVAPFREGLVVAAECMFAWYWRPGRSEPAAELGHARDARNRETSDLGP